MNIISIGDLVPKGNFKLHSSFSKAINYQMDTSLLSLVDKPIGGGPYNIVLEKLPLNPLTTLDTNNFDFSKVIDTSIETLECPVKQLKNMLLGNAKENSLTFLLNESNTPNQESSFKQHLNKAYHKASHNIFSTSNILLGIKQMRGLGIGLTPSGDDFIAGLLLSLKLGKLSHNLIHQVYHKALSDNPYSNTLFLSSFKGHAVIKLKRLLGPWKDEAKGIEYLNDFLTFGETSSCDFLTGFILGMERKNTWQ